MDLINNMQTTAMTVSSDKNLSLGHGKVQTVRNYFKTVFTIINKLIILIVYKLSCCLEIGIHCCHWSL